MQVPYRLVVSAAVIGALILSLNLWWIHSPWLGVPAFFFYFGALALVVSRSRENRSQAPVGLYWAGLTLLFGISLLGTIIYYPYALTNAAVEIILLAPLFFVYLSYRTPFVFNNKPAPRQRRAMIGCSLLALLCLAADGLLLALVYINRTNDVLRSPWQVLGPEFFLLYLTATALVIWRTVRRERLSPLDYALISVHLFATYSVAGLIYPLGYGFDGFIHRATESWIYEHGFITPKQPVYIGQYSLVVWLARLTALPVWHLDVWLVPVLAAISLPPLFVALGHRLWNISAALAVQGVWLVPWLFFVSFHLTTPYNLVLLLTIITAGALALTLTDSLPWSVPWLLCAAALGTHALLGAPLALLVGGAWVVSKINRVNLRAGVLTAYVIISALSVPALFLVYLKMGGHDWPALVNPLAKIPHFFALFERPYWFSEQAPSLFEFLYRYDRLIGPLAFILGLSGFILDRNKKSVQYIFPLTALSFVLGSWLLRSWLVFPGVGRLEQGDYPLRLVKTSLLFLLPWSGYALYLLAAWIGAQAAKLPAIIRRLLPASAILCSGVLLMISFYLSYPQENPKVHFPGFNVTATDLAAAEWIHQDNAAYSYVVLSNPLVGAAALTKYSFAKYFATPAGQISYYSVPSGGPLYGLYEEMWLSGQKRETMEKAMNLAGVNKAYFVIPSYWKNFNQIVAGAKASADRSHEIDGGKIWIFVYTRPGR